MKLSYKKYAEQEMMYVKIKESNTDSDSIEDARHKKDPRTKTPYSTVT